MSYAIHRLYGIHVNKLQNSGGDLTIHGEECYKLINFVCRYNVFFDITEQHPQWLIP